MKIAAVETLTHYVPTRRPVQDAIQGFSFVEYVVVRIKTEDGLEGVGWTYSISRTALAVKALIDNSYKEILVGSDSSRIEYLWASMWNRTRSTGAAGIGTTALAAVDIALWDLAGKRRGLPLYKLLGAYRDKIFTYASGINFNLSGQELVEEMNEFLSQGFRAVKLKIGKDDPQEDGQRLGAVREVIGENSLLFVDANQKWTVGEAISAAKRIEQFQPVWLEEPLAAEDTAGYEILSKRISIPLAAGETHFTKHEFLNLMRGGALQYVQADVYRVGGITEWLKIAHLAEAWNLPMAPHAAEEIHVHLLCAIPNAFILEYAPIANFNDSGAILNPLRPRDSYTSPPEEPGHGYKIDWGLLEEWSQVDDF